jgi:hypothetical protein
MSLVSRYTEKAEETTPNKNFFPLLIVNGRGGGGGVNAGEVSLVVSLRY